MENNQDLYLNQISKIIELSIEKTIENSVRLCEYNATYYYNLINTNYCIIVSDDGSYLLTSADIVRFEKLLSLFKKGNRNGDFDLDDDRILDRIDYYTEMLAVDDEDIAVNNIEIKESEPEIIEEYDAPCEFKTLDNKTISTVFSSQLGNLERINDKSYRIGNLLILLSACPSEYELNKYASDWLSNNNLDIIYEKNKEYKINNYRVIEKQVNSSNIVRVFKFVCVEKTMIMFTYGSLFSSYSEVIDKAIENIEIK